MRRIKNKILKGLYIANFISLLIFATALDGNNLKVPLIVCGVNLLYIGLFTIANTRE